MSCVQLLVLQLLRYPEDGNWEDAGGWSDRGASEPSTPEDLKDMHLERVEAIVDDDVGKLFKLDTTGNVGSY